MKFTLSLSLLLLLSSSLFADSVFSKTYEGCGSSKQEALYTLSANIQSRISTHIEQTVVTDGDDDVKSKISDYTSSATNLSLVNIEYVTKKKEICAVVHKDDQVKNTQKLLTQALLYDKKNIPTDVDAKIETLSTWLANIKQLSYLMPVFLQGKAKEQAVLNKKEKIFTDIYTNSIAYSNSLFFKSCKSTREKAEVALNKKLFMQKEKEKGFLSSVTSIFHSDDSTEMLDNFSAQLLEVKKDGDICVMLKKAEMLNIAQKMYADAMRMGLKSLPKDPKKRYKSIKDNLYEQLNVTKAVLKLFPKKYKEHDFEKLDAKRKELADILEKTYPQYVIFHVSGGEKIEIRVDGTLVKNNTKKYIKSGDHTYKITAKDKCPIIDTFDNDLFDDETITKDLSSESYPTVVFQTDKSPSITLAGIVLKANVTHTIKKCKDKAHYIATFAHQTLVGDVDTSPGENSTILLHFLSEKEFSVFTNAKSKKFTAVSGERFSESLTPITSENLKFSLERKPLHGTVTIEESGSFEYLPEEGYVGKDDFGYIIEGPEKSSGVKLVSLTIEPAKGSAAVPPQYKESGLKQEPLPMAAPIVKQKPLVAKKPVEPEKVLKQEPVVQKKSKNLEDTVSYEQFKMYVSSKQPLTKEFLVKIKKKFPNYFEKLREEMINNQ